MSNELINLNPKTFFALWRDDQKTTFGLIILAFFLGTVILVVFANFPEVSQVAIIYMILLIVGGFGGLFDIVFRSIGFKDLFAGAGKHFYIALFVGLIIGLIIFLLQLFSVSIPFAISGNLFIILFAIVVAPLTEEIFFRGLLQHITAGFFRSFLGQSVLISGIFATFIQASIFALYHFSVFGGSPEKIFSSFIFAIIVTIGNAMFRSLGFGMGLHFTNNFTVSLQQGFLF